jgi:toxin HigB-1
LRNDSNFITQWVTVGAMKVSIATKLRKVLEDDQSINRKYGKLAQPLKARLAVLKASPTLAHVSRGKPERLHQLTQDRDERFAVDVKDQWRLVFEVDHNPVPRTKDGGIDRSAVTAIMVTEVSDHYK